MIFLHMMDASPPAMWQINKSFAVFSLSACIVYAPALSNEKTISVHSIMVSLKAPSHLGKFCRREMDVSKQKVSEVLTGGTK